jgi:HK97 family phage prohead protease
MKKETRRLSSPVEVRAMNADGLPEKIGGIAAVVNTITDMGWYEEMIAPGAFDEALTRSDIRCLFNHEEECILGRMKSGTCSVIVNADGHLEYENTMDYQSPTHQNVGVAVRRGDISESSFSFVPEAVEWRESSKYGAMNLRVITKIKQLYDVSPVTYAAYPEGTSTESRSLQDERSAFLPEVVADESHSADVVKVALARYRNY